MRKILIIPFVLAAIGSSQALAQSAEAPEFMRQTMPEAAVQPAWEELQAVMADGALSAKTKELIGLATAAQIPCEYCRLYHRQAAERAGATDAEIREALASAALVRKWSTMLNGLDYDIQAFEQEVNGMLAAAE